MGCETITPVDFEFSLGILFMLKNSQIDKLKCLNFDSHITHAAAKIIAPSGNRKLVANSHFKLRF